jgi:hypothetical protein
MSPRSGAHVRGRSARARPALRVWGNGSRPERVFETTPNSLIVTVFRVGQRAFFPRPFRPPGIGGVPRTPGFTRGFIPAAFQAAAAGPARFPRPNGPTGFSPG